MQIQRLSHADPAAILSQSNANPVPIYPNLMPIQCQFMPIRCRSIPKMLPIRSKSNANPMPIHCQSIPIRCESVANPAPFQCQSDSNLRESRFSRILENYFAISPLDLDLEAFKFHFHFSKRVKPKIISLFISRKE